MESSQRPFLCLAIATMLLQLLSSREQLECSSEGEVRLVDGRNDYEGRVEVCDDGQWKTVCDRMWLEEEAKVVCRQLNYSNPLNATYVRRGCAGQGPEDQDTLKVVWRCSGEESKLLDCNRTNTTSPCDHRRDAGVYCSGRTPDNCEEDAIRLMDGPNSASGRVEVCRFGCWGTVCDEGWDRYDANTTCRQLGFDSDRAIPVRGGYFGNANTSMQIHISQTECGMDNNVLANCSMFMLNNCTHSQDAGVFCYESGTSLCKDGDVQLCDKENFKQSKGRVEMCLNGVWGTVCADGWNEVANNIVCTQLGHSTGPGNHSISLGNYPPLFENIVCRENYSMLLQCIDMHNFGIYNDCESGTAEVICEMPNISSENVSDSMSTSHTTDLMSPTTSNSESNPQSPIAGVVSGLLAIGVIIAVGVASVTVVVVVVKRKQGRRKLNFEKGSDSGMDNPTYNDCQGTQTLNNMTVSRGSLEREFDNPIYSDEKIKICHHDIDSASNTTSQQPENIPHYEGVCFKGTIAVTVNSNEALHIYESADLDNGEIEGAGINEIAATGTDNGIEANDGEIMKGATSGEGEYELPPNLDDYVAGGGDEGCYSTLDPTYSQLQPHTGVPKPALEVQIPQNDDEYSHLKY